MKQQEEIDAILMKIKPGICSIFFKPYTLEIVLRYLHEIEAESSKRFPVEFDTQQEEDQEQQQPHGENGFGSQCSPPHIFFSNTLDSLNNLDR